MLGRGAEFEVIDAPSFQSKVARAARDAAYEAGRTPLLADQYERTRDMIEAARVQLRRGIGDVFEAADAREATAMAEIDGVWCRCRCDAVDFENRIIWDYKTTAQSAAPAGLGRLLAGMLYHVQAAHYVDVMTAVHGGTWRFKFVVQENSEPYLLTYARFPQSLMDTAHRMTARAREIWRRCLERGEWPGYPACEVEVEPPPWAEARWYEAESRREDHRQRTGRDVLDEGMRFQAPHSMETAG